jgi:two-component system, chemotaxis family, response regulator PixG
MTVWASDAVRQDFQFSESKIVRCLDSLRSTQFTGELIWRSAKGEKQWKFYFHSGYLFYATGGTHPVRRWARNIANHCSQIQINITKLHQDLRGVAPESLICGWEYYLFGRWIEQGKLTHQQVNQTIQSILREVLFDLSQEQDLTHEMKQIEFMSEPVTMLDEQKIFMSVQRLWQNLWNYSIDVNLLDKAPVIRNSMRLRECVSTEAYQTLTQLLDGEKSLFDLAAQIRQDVVQVARSLLPYIRADWVELVSIPDLPDLVDATTAKTKSPAKPLIACVDDSLIVCLTMEKLLTVSGYQFIGINDGLRAITTLLTRKPDLIFLDVFMPGISGYEICKNLRKAPSFQNTPIVFLTGLNGVVDQVRARLSGASDFISKPFEAENVLKIIARHLS